MAADHRKPVLVRLTLFYVTGESTQYDCAAGIASFLNDFILNYPLGQITKVKLLTRLARSQRQRRFPILDRAVDRLLLNRRKIVREPVSCCDLLEWTGYTADASMTQRRARCPPGFDSGMTFASAETKLGCFARHLPVARPESQGDEETVTQRPAGTYRGMVAANYLTHRCFMASQIAETSLSTPSDPSIRIDPVRSWRDRDDFLRLPWKIYAHDPVWVPPLLAERRQFIDPRKHPFYKHGAAALFIARRGNECVGRIMASDDPNYNQQHGTNVGCFGLFESVDEPAVAHLLLEQAARWLRARGRTQILGPIDYSTNYTCGLLIDGFDTPPRVMMSHHPTYYRALLESWQLSKAKDMYSWWFTDHLQLESRWMKLANRFARRGNVKIREFRKQDATADIDRCKQIYNEAWRHNWGFVKMTDAEFADFAGELIDLMPPELVLLAEIGDKVVGLAMTLPDFNEAVRPLNGRLFRWGLPLGYWQFKRNLKKIRTGRLIALGVLEDHRRRGVTELLILHTLINGKRYGNFNAAELGWTLEDNDLINRAIEASGGERYKTYRIFEKTL